MSAVAASAIAPRPLGRRRLWADPDFLRLFAAQTLADLT
jgi:hypothetical protein